ncbi:MAG: benzoyl-CoA 2,3-epoxidase subunit BoxA [Burkholderiales bacterium]|nr:benzoyl-CoA 2,3-epoxidase subunit BoxA [Burkholderiales bacterium]
MSATADPAILRQHLIDPEICIRCNTCEESCPVDAITHDSRNYVVKADQCNYCMACVPPCPTGAIDNWRNVLKADAYSVDEQLTWDLLPSQKHIELAAKGDAIAASSTELLPAEAEQLAQANSAIALGAGATVPPWSAAHPYVNLYGHKAPVTATVSGNFRVTELGTDSDTHHIVLDFGSLPFPVLEGQSIGVIPPGVDGNGRAHHARQYSIASPRDGERPNYNNISLTVKRVTEDYDGKPVRGVASNYLCDLKKGDIVQVIGPFGASFLMPNHANSNLLMICTGTGSAPMRAMTERRRRRRDIGEGGKLMLFFGARSQKELPYFGPLMNLPKDFIDINFAFSRTPNQPRRYVQDALRERAADVAALLKDKNTSIYVCGIKGMEAGVLDVLRDTAIAHGMDWQSLHADLKREGRLHLETY